MLLASDLDRLPDDILELYERYQVSVINDIARRLARMNMTDTAAWQMQRLVQSGRVYENALEEIAKLTGKSEQELKRLFEAAGVKAMRFDDAVYRAAGLNPLPLNLSPAMVQVLAAGLQKTNNVMRNLTMTTAIDAQNQFVAAADLAYMQITGGAMGYQQAIKAAIVDVAGQGLSVIQFPGRRDQLDVAMRRAVLTGVNQSVGQLQTTRADEMGCDLVEVTAHIGARPTHTVWQGKIFSRSGKSTKYPHFATITGYGTGAGLMGWNCRHNFYPFFDGISERAYSDAELNSWANRTVTLDGEEVPIYEATQRQREIERRIRYWKRQAGALEAAGLDNSRELAKVSEWQAKMRSFVQQTGLQRQRFREQVFAGRPTRRPPMPAPPEPKTPTAPEPTPTQQPETQGIPVSQALDIKARGKTGKAVEFALEKIDSVHSDGSLPIIPVTQNSGRSRLGYYSFSYGGRSVEISISRYGEHPELTLAHEAGHFLDHAGIGQGVFASERSELLSGWREAVKNSQAYQLLRDMLADPRKFAAEFPLAGGVYSVTPDVRHLAYLADTKELFARSYAQYIAVRSGDPILLAQLNKERSDKIYGARQWSDEDFAPIAAAFDQLFRSLGWLR